MPSSKVKKPDKAIAPGSRAGPTAETSDTSIPSTLDDEISIEEFTPASLDEEVQDLSDESIASEREASLNRDEPELDLDRLDPVPPK
ncbi:MAG: hypothetical protein V4634_08130 [Pseudomonadota bacterium]